MEILLYFQFFWCVCVFGWMDKKKNRFIKGIQIRNYWQSELCALDEYINVNNVRTARGNTLLMFQQ